MGSRAGNKERRFGEADRRACWIADIKGDLMRVEDARIGQKVRGPTGWIGSVEEIKKHELVVKLSNGLDYVVSPNWVTLIDDPCNSCSTLIARAGEIGEKDAEITKLKCDLDFANARIKLLQSRVCETNRHVESLMGIRFDSKEAAEENAKLRSKNRAQNNALYAWEEASRKQRDEITFLKAERDRLAETVRFQDEKIRKMSECNKKVTYSPTIGHDQKMSTDEIKAIIGEHRDRWTAKLNISPMQYDNLQRDARIVLELMASYLPLSLTDISDRLGWKMPRVCETMAMLRIAGRVKLEKGEYRLVE